MSGDAGGRTVTRRAWLGRLGVGTLGIGCTARVAAAGTAATGRRQVDGAWPQFHYDGANSGHAPDERGPTGSVGSRLAVDVGGAVTTGPVVSGASIYVVDDRAGVLRAIDRTDGTVRWEERADVSASWPSVDGDTVYLPGRNVRALATADGSQRWSTSVPGRAHGVVRVRSSVVAAGRAGVTVLNADSGSQRWHDDGVVTWREPPAVVDDDVFVVDSGSGIVVAFNVGGGRRWIRRFGEPAPGSPTVVDDLVIVPIGGTVYAFVRSTGVTAWTADVRLDTAVAVADGVAYGVAGDELVAIAILDGTERWRRPVPTTTSPPVVAGETVYLAGDDGTVVAVDATDGTIHWETGIGDPFRTAFAVAGGELYAGTQDGTLHALAAGFETSTPTTTATSAGASTAAPGATRTVTPDSEEEGADSGILATVGGAALLTALLARGRAVLAGDDDPD